MFFNIIPKDFLRLNMSRVDSFALVCLKLPARAIQMYLDGNAEEVVKWFLAAPAGVPITPNDLELKIGLGNNAWNCFKRVLDEVVMFSRTLSENEVSVGTL